MINNRFRLTLPLARKVGPGHVYLKHANAVIDGFTITNGAIIGPGGGVYISTLGGTVRNCLVINNTASDIGGGIGMVAGRVEGSVIQANNSLSTGSGIYMGAGTVSNCSISYNVSTAGVEGGGVYINPTGRVENCTIKGNRGWSGGIMIWYDGSVANCKITDNVSTSTGAGGIYFYNGATASGGALVENCTISNNINQVNNGAGGIVFRKEAAVNGAIVRNCLISCNTNTGSGGSGNSGGVVWLYHQGNSKKCRLENCTVINNKGNNGDGGVKLYGGGQIVNCLIYSNRNSNIEWSSTALTGTGRVDFSCCYPKADMGTEGGNNTTNNPLLVDTNAGNFRLTKDSPCINTGSNMAWMATAKDLDGRSRLDYFSRQVDMGAYEFLPAGIVFSGH